MSEKIFSVRCSEDSEDTLEIFKYGTEDKYLTFRFKVSESNEITLSKDQIIALKSTLGKWLNE